MRNLIIVTLLLVWFLITLVFGLTVIPLIIVTLIDEWFEYPRQLINKID